MEKEKIVGILGGMGPEATVELMRRIVAAVPAQFDQDHIRCIVDQNGKIPCRIKAIQGKGPSSGPVLADMGRRLEQYGADLLCMPCNTAHYFMKDVQDAVHIPFVDMIEVTARHVHEAFPDVTRVAVLCTIPTRQTGLYDKRLQDYGITAEYLDPMRQEELLSVIAAVKAARVDDAVRARLDGVLRWVREQGIEVMIVACTELSVICPKEKTLVDALDCLVAELVRQVKGA